MAVLPMPSETDTARDAWWTALLQKDEPRVHVVARLPFWAPRPDGAPTVQALVIATTEPDPSRSVTARCWAWNSIWTSAARG